MKPLINEHDEFLLSRLLDNDLPPAEAETLRRRIEAEPALARAYARMARLDSLLKERRADQPQMDWKAFHARVTNRVERAAEAKASSPIIRLSRWLAIGVPLAAAAAIALAVILWPPIGSTKPDGNNVADGPTGGRPPLGELLVKVDQPTPAPPAVEGSIKVHFKRSQQLAELTWQADAVADEQPESFVSGVVPGALPLDIGEALLAELPL